MRIDLLWLLMAALCGLCIVLCCRVAARVLVCAPYSVVPTRLLSTSDWDPAVRSLHSLLPQVRMWTGVVHSLRCVSRQTSQRGYTETETCTHQHRACCEHQTDIAAHAHAYAHAHAFSLARIRARLQCASLHARCTAHVCRYRCRCVACGSCERLPAFKQHSNMHASAPTCSHH